MPMRCIERFKLVLCLALPFVGGAASSGCAGITEADEYKLVECSSNADCARSRGDNTVCRKSDRTCQGLLTAECTSVLGDWRDDDAVLLGATVALTGPNASVGIPERNAIELALNDLRTSANGLPPRPGSSKRRPLAVVVCDDASTNAVATRSAEHLTKVLQVPAIVGPSWSGVAVSLLSNVTVPTQTLMIATGTTSPDFTGLDKSGLFFRTIESMTLETKAMSGLVLEIEKLVRAKGLVVPTKVSLLHKGDSYGKGSAQAMVKTVQFNALPALDPGNQANFLQLDYGDSGNPTASPLKYNETVASVLAQKPHIIVSIGTGEVFANVVGAVEKSWDPALPYRPYWILPHTQFTGATTDFLKSNDADGGLRKRILGATPGSEDLNYQQFKINYQTQVRDGTSPNSFGASNTYDSVYVAAFAIASLREQSITGRNMANAIANLVGPGQKISVNISDLNTGLNLLSQGQKIDVHGVSGPLNFDLTTGDVAQETQIWCVPAGGDGKPEPPKVSGFSFKEDAVTPISTFGDVPKTCGW
jgi:ABC-type branched-subunit amino acid transport system substrate-binding protein